MAGKEMEMNREMMDKLEDARKLYQLSKKIGSVYIRTGYTDMPAGYYYRLVSMLLQKETLSGQFSEDMFFEKDNPCFEDYGIGYVGCFDELLDAYGEEREPYCASQLLFFAFHEMVRYGGYTEKEALDMLAGMDGAGLLREMYDFVFYEDEEPGDEPEEYSREELMEQRVEAAHALAGQLRDCRMGILSLDDAVLLEPVHRMTENMFTGLCEEPLFLKHFFGICFLLYASYVSVKPDEGSWVGLKYVKYTGGNDFVFRHLGKLPGDDVYVQMAGWCLERLTDSYVKEKVSACWEPFISELACCMETENGIMLTALCPCMDGAEDTLFLPDFSYLTAKYILPVLSDYLRQTYGEVLPEEDRMQTACTV